MPTIVQVHIDLTLSFAIASFQRVWAFGICISDLLFFTPAAATPVRLDTHIDPVVLDTAPVYVDWRCEQQK
jgi:hypothetical protein